MMDSGNSGSLQSSSGGEDEFDSRAGGGGGGGVDSSPLSALLRPSPSPSAAAFSLHGSLYGLQEFTSAPPPPPQQQQQAAPWSGQFTGAAGASSSSPRIGHADAGAGGRSQQVDTSATGQGAATAAPPPRGSRKRTRASRRAPTTVLTTDTSNFRAMVQEFTGIPSPPFAAGVGAPAASLRTRFDHIFPSPSSLRSAAGAAVDTASLPPYLLRPFAQKLPTAPSTFPPFTSSSSSTPSSSNIGVANANAATGTATTAAGSSNLTAQSATAAGVDDTFQLTSSALLRLQDPNSYLSFQNLLDSQPSSQSMFGAAGGFAQAPRLHEPSPSSPSEFLTGMGSGSLGVTHGGLMGSEGLHLHQRSDVHHGGDELSGVVAGGGSCKLNYSHAGAATSSSAAASVDKPPDGGAGAPARPGRGEGLDPWICTSE
ncbi:nuclear pore complex protein NUP62-like [Phragmites australis]|uniref:nuclear pore complex protein NUP62-like n=1 Tax=Phragmites australis TaxID=29695 RepID=UPI002D76992B|nr:nuclear pore complex protein NUP62-like [Phragmites australis]